MKTSYFALSAKHPHAVSISRGIPKWYTGRQYQALAPAWWIIKLENPADYVSAYRKNVLDKLDPRQVYADLGSDAVLLCYEKPGEFCHRRLVASWLIANLGIEVPELETSSEGILLPKVQTLF